MGEVCDNKSIGILVRNGKGELLLIERKKYNFGFAPPAGHLDGDSFENAAKKELEEEVGLTGRSYTLLLEKELQNPCRREGGTHHLWQVFEVGGVENLNIKASEDETKSYIWADIAKLKTLSALLEEFMKKNNFLVDDLPALVAATNNSLDWQENPGLEPPWYILLESLKII